MRNRSHAGPIAMLGAVLQDRSQQIVVLFHDRTTSYMKRYRLCFLGFGNVGRALARLLGAKSQELRERYDVEYDIVGVATRRMGWRANGQAFSNADEVSSQN